MKRLFVLICVICVICGCTQDAYEKGEGKYSLMRADFVEARANAQKQIDQIITDDGEQLQASKPFTSKLVVTPDSVYRCILYYNKVRDEKGQYVFEPVSIGEVSCPKIIPLSGLDKEMKTDPVTVNSVWVGKDRKYLNLNIGLKMGTTESENNLHSVGMVCTKTEDGITYYTFYHDQADIPQYYTQNVLLTVDCAKEKIIDLTINTYNGTWHKQFIVYS